MATHPLNLPAVSDDIVERVNQALTLEARIDDAVAKAEQALADSGTSEIQPTATPGLLKVVPK